MPHPTKKKQTSRQKAVVRQRRSRHRKLEKDEFRHLEYLNSQLDRDGNPLNILETDEELLNNEQKFITRFIRSLSSIDMRSIAIFIDEHYDEADVSEFVENYYLNKEDKSWSDTFFKITYRCLGVLNLNDLLTKKIFEYTNDIIQNVKPTDKPVLTEELLENIIDECFKGIHNLNSSELINNFLLVYSQNAQYCIVDDEDIMYGGLYEISVFEGLFATFFYIIMGCWLFAWAVNAADRNDRRNRRNPYHYL